jgi:hypothetical protein
MQSTFRKLGALAAVGAALTLSAPAFAHPPNGGNGNGNCNSGRGNGSEGDSSQLIEPSTGSSGIAPTVDCDPGNSGDKNRGGD